MKKAQLLELVNNVNTFGEAWDASQVLYNKDAKDDNYTTNDFEFTFKPGEVTCSAVKVTRKTVNKESTYTKKFNFKETATTMPEAFKKAALRLLS
jgi:hypothetical protein